MKRSNSHLLDEFCSRFRSYFYAHQLFMLAKTRVVLGWDVMHVSQLLQRLTPFIAVDMANQLEGFSSAVRFRWCSGRQCKRSTTTVWEQPLQQSDPTSQMSEETCATWLISCPKEEGEHGAR